MAPSSILLQPLLVVAMFLEQLQLICVMLTTSSMVWPPDNVEKIGSGLDQLQLVTVRKLLRV